ncbi:MAG: Gfo/Idh/MocA family oxidoreductase, partial [Vicinamibacterales bacterium]
MRVAVVGVGHLGRHHARLLSGMAGVTLVGVVDARPERAAEIAAEFGTTAIADWRTLPGAVDAVTIAAPTEAHEAIALPL